MNNLDTLFSPSCWTKRPLTPSEIIENHVKLIEEASQQSRETIPNELGLPYGLLNKEKIDVFGIDLSDDAPILVFIHGGYWQEKGLERGSYHYISQHLHANGIKTIFIGYELCPDVTLPEIIEGIEKSARKCIEYAISKKSRYGIEARPIRYLNPPRKSTLMEPHARESIIFTCYYLPSVSPRVSLTVFLHHYKLIHLQHKEANTRGLIFAGHSAGAHLVATLFTNFIRLLAAKDQELVKAAIFLSGVFDLVPLIKTYVNEPLNLDERTALELSPSNLEIFDKKSTSFYIIVGADESPEFIKQSKNFSEKLESSDMKSEFFIMEDLDHFNIMELLADDDSEITKFIVDKFKAL